MFVNVFFTSHRFSLTSVARFLIQATKFKTGKVSGKWGVLDAFPHAFPPYTISCRFPPIQCCLFALIGKHLSQVDQKLLLHHVCLGDIEDNGDISASRKV